MKLGRPRTLPDRACAHCGKRFRPHRATSRFCSLACVTRSRHLNARPERPRYAYNGRLSDALWREIHAARAEAATAPLYRPGASL